MNDNLMTRLNKIALAFMGLVVAVLAADVILPPRNVENAVVSNRWIGHSTGRGGRVFRIQTKGDRERKIAVRKSAFQQISAGDRVEISISKILGIPKSLKFKIAGGVTVEDWCDLYFFGLTALLFWLVCLFGFYRAELAAAFNGHFQKFKNLYTLVSLLFLGALLWYVGV